MQNAADQHMERQLDDNRAVRSGAGSPRRPSYQTVLHHQFHDLRPHPQTTQISRRQVSKARSATERTDSKLPMKSKPSIPRKSPPFDDAVVERSVEDKKTQEALMNAQTRLKEAEAALRSLEEDRDRLNIALRVSHLRTIPQCPIWGLGFRSRCHADKICAVPLR